MSTLQPVVLTGSRVVLRPLVRDDVRALTAIGLDPELWRLTTNWIRTEADMAAYVEQALAEQASGTALPFVTTIRETGEIVGSTRFGAIVPQHKRLEIGWTWITPKWQRTFVNTEAKRLMLEHAFETLGVNRVEFKTALTNHRSQAALKRLGATQEGIFRSHMVNPSGSIRDSVYFSIIRAEWPAVKAALNSMRV